MKTYETPIRVAVSVSLSLMGDALLYAVLPSQAERLGIPLVFVGLMLSANRFVRLLTNTWAATLFQKFGREWLFFVSVIVASFTTLTYGMSPGVFVFLFARILWGTCWSFLNLGLYLTVLDYIEKEERGTWLGTTKSISRIGTILAVSVGGYMTDRVGFGTVMLVLGFVSMSGGLLAYPTANKPSKPSAKSPSHEATSLDHSSPKDKPYPLSLKGRNQSTKRSINPFVVYGMGFVNGFVSSGVIMGTLSLLLIQRFGSVIHLMNVPLGVATLSGFLLAMNWMIQIVFSPASGYLADRFGAERIFPLAVVGQAIMLVILALIQDALALMVVGTLLFISTIAASINLDAIASHVSLSQRRVALTMSHFVTAHDLGSALGPLVGYLVGIGLGLSGLYIGAAWMNGLVIVLFLMETKTQSAKSTFSA